MKSAPPFVRSVQITVFVLWILIPLVLLFATQFIQLLGWIAFTVGLLKLGIEGIRLFGNPDKWIPGHRQRAEEEHRNDHYIYHCKMNPKGFARLRAENLRQQAEED